MKKSINTLLKSHGSFSKKNHSVNPPVVRTSTILFDSMQELASHEKKILQDKPITHYAYGRSGSQTTIELQNIVKELEQAYHVFLHSTGFGSVSLAFMALCQSGDQVLVGDNVYYPTREITEKLLPKYNITTKYYDPNNIKDLQNKITKKTKLIFVENPGSITFEFQDLKEIVKLAKKNNITTVIDNTWGTPMYLKPLSLGFDVSICSATKYFSGHSDAMGGTLSVNKKTYNKVKFCDKMLGSRLSADEAYLIIRGLRTLDVRLKTHQENTIKVINFLKRQKKIKEVLYPHKVGSKDYKMWKKYYSGSTGLFSIVIKAKKKLSVLKFVNKLELFGIGYSWGGFESLAIYHDVSKIRTFYKFGKDEHLVRIHIGLEDSSDLILDLKNSLKFIN
jgi:cystathionine beta-lyase